MKTLILNKLKHIERDHNIKILFAVESGSRAWGFASPDSDYDIRFVYKHQNDWYLNLWEQKDTIQFMTDNDLDGSGWDIRKALRLLAKSNASFNGWLFSPIVYRADMGFLNEIKAVAKRNFNPVSGFYHFHSMNKSFEDTLGTNTMTLKSFFYAFRTALCANWIYKKQSIPPMLFKEMYELVDSIYHTEIDTLISVKAKHIEKSNASVNSELINLVRSIINENNSVKNELVHKKPNPNDFNALFFKTLQ